jgi:alanine-synthesizing transaminase
MKTIKKSDKLEHVCYDIRGPVLDEAKRLEEEGSSILKLNIGNPAPFGLFAPDEIIRDMALNIRNAQGYVDSKGLFSARKAIMQYCQSKRIAGVDIDDIYVGNGVSELIAMSMQGLLNPGDEILIPSPDYPLWTAAVTLAGGAAVHYTCDESSDWYPDIDNLESLITDRCKGIVVINPNNPPGALYPQEILERIVGIGAEKNLILFSDEIYDKVIYDDAPHVSLASLRDDVFCITFNGLSKAYRSAGFRVGWMVLSGRKEQAGDYIRGLDILANMRLCGNVPGQYAVQTALGGYQSIDDLVRPGGRLFEQRNLCHELLSSIPGVSCVKPKAALYCFPRLDTARFGIISDERLVLDLLREQKVLVVQGTGFNWPDPDHIRIVFLPNEEDLRKALGCFGDFLSRYTQEH